MDFLRRECADADGLSVSMDMLLYGGLMPFRLHMLGKEAAQRCMDTVQKLRVNHPALRYFRVSDSEKLNYYAQCGHEIHMCDEAEHRFQSGLYSEVQHCTQSRPPDVLRDYLGRRAFNLRFLQHALDLVAFTEMDLQTRCLMYPDVGEAALTLVYCILLELRGQHPEVYVKYAAHAAAELIPAYENRSLGESLKQVKSTAPEEKGTRK